MYTFTSYILEHMSTAAAFENKYRIGFINTSFELNSQFQITVVAGNSGRQRGKKLKVLISKVC